MVQVGVSIMVFISANPCLHLCKHDVMTPCINDSYKSTVANRSQNMKKQVTKRQILLPKQKTKHPQRCLGHQRYKDV
jgi:hypothetical protein